jgi:indoleamine 2,3-dioxygenase
MDLLREHEVDPERGFLPPADPLERLPPAFEPWEAVAPRVSALLLAGRLRATLEALPILESAKLESREELERAMLLLSVFGNAYVWAEAEPARTIPRPVAVPWHQVAHALGRPPIVSHASIVLRNWRRIDRDGAIVLENLETLQLFGGSPDEQWFYLIPMAMEAHGAKALVAIARARRAVVDGRLDSVAANLDTIGTTVAELTDILSRTQEQCDPYIFYRRVRPYLAGWPEPGLVYEGVSDQPVRLAGGSAAQSSLFQAIDAALGVSHEHEHSRPFLLAMRGHMPPKHRALLEKLDAGGPQLRAMVLDHRADRPQLAERYNTAVLAMDHFRKIHFEIAVRYITRQAPEPDDAKGTGGTELATFLKKTRDETRETLLDTN